MITCPACGGVDIVGQVCRECGARITTPKSTGSVSFDDREDPRIGRAEDARDFPEDNGRDVW